MTEPCNWADLHQLTLPSDATVLVASDMHIGQHDPDTAAFFLNALHGALTVHSHLVLLGDLFEAWPGDDQNDAQANALIRTLSALRQSGLAIYVMRGNRDFLLDVPLPASRHPSFAEQCGITMLPDLTCLTLGVQQIVLLHGDTLCTDDMEYQAFRQQCRQTSWQHQFLSQSLTERVRIAKAYRAASIAGHHARTQKNQEIAAITDVNQQAVDRALEQARCRVMLHGHTHRPACHTWHVNGSARVRYVLPDWDATARRGGFFEITTNAITTRTPG